MAEKYTHCSIATFHSIDSKKSVQKISQELMLCPKGEE
jgi:hypothetical protein